MFDYFSIVWDELDRRQSEVAASISQELTQIQSTYSRVVDKQGLSVYCVGQRKEGSRAHVLHHENGAVLGTLFRKAQGRSIIAASSLNRDASEDVIRSKGGALIRSYWGRYASFHHDAESRETIVIRDPTGGMPCYWSRIDGVTIYFSSVDHFSRLNLLPLTINWSNVSTRLSIVLIHSESTGLNEIFELRAGERAIHCRREHRKTFLWNPVDVAASAPIEDRQRAATMLYETTRECVNTWASCYSGIVQELSGGLDSSIVLSALADAPSKPRIAALNFFAEGADADERRYARLVASHMRTSLTELARPVNIDLSAITTCSRTAMPSSCYVRAGISNIERQVAQQFSASAWFTGDGGDELYYRLSASNSAVDYFREHRLSAKFFAVALDAAYTDGVSIWNVFSKTIRHGVLSKRPRLAFSARSEWGAVTQDVIEKMSQRTDFSHPWFSSPNKLPPGKLAQAFLLSFPPEFHDPLGAPESPERVCPLLSQPLIELCLRIPTYVLASGGWDRTLARRAFENDVPAEVINRRTKGGVAEYSREVLRDNIDFLRDCLLDGILVKERLLDRSILEAALSANPTAVKCWPNDIFEYACIEVWLQKCSKAPSRNTAYINQKLAG